MTGSIFSATEEGHDISNLNSHPVDCNLCHGVGIVPHSGEAHSENNRDKIVAATFLTDYPKAGEYAKDARLCLRRLNLKRIEQARRTRRCQQWLKPASRAIGSPVTIYAGIVDKR